MHEDDQGSVYWMQKEASCAVDGYAVDGYRLAGEARISNQRAGMDGWAKSEGVEWTSRRPLSQASPGLDE